MKPVSCRPSRNAVAFWGHGLLSGDPKLKNPTTGIAGCCARAMSGQVVAPPNSVMNSRRFN
jgi:hypothetical protein